MKPDEDVDQQIRKLLDYAKDTDNDVKETDRHTDNDECTAKEKDSDNNISRLIDVLEKNEKVYAKIHTCLTAGNHQTITNELLRDSISSSLVCENMMKVLKEISAERNESMENERVAKEKMNEMMKVQFEQKKRINKLIDDLKYCSNANNELLRLVQDQKGRINAYREKYEQERKNVQSTQTINSELEKLREKSADKIMVLNKEIRLMSDRVRECHAQIAQMRDAEQRKEESERSFESQVIEMERSLNEQRQALEEKSKALEMCNSELAALLSKEKRMKERIEDLKEKSEYYERLYRSINEQNEYLNAQLARFINDTGCLQDGSVEESANDGKDAVPADQDRKAVRQKMHKYRKQLRKYKRLFDAQNEQISTLKENLGRADAQFNDLQNEFLALHKHNAENTAKKKDVMDDLLNKMKDLMNKNLDYQNRIIQLERRHGRHTDNRSDRNVDKEAMHYGTDAGRDIRNAYNTQFINDRRNEVEIVDDEFKDFDTTAQEKDDVNEPGRWSAYFKKAKTVNDEKKRMDVQDKPSYAKIDMHRPSYAKMDVQDKPSYAKMDMHRPSYAKMDVQDKPSYAKMDMHRPSYDKMDMQGTHPSANVYRPSYDKMDVQDKPSHAGPSDNMSDETGRNIFNKNKNVVADLWNKLTRSVKDDGKDNDDVQTRMNDLNINKEEGDVFYDISSQQDKARHGKDEKVKDVAKERLFSRRTNEDVMSKAGDGMPMMNDTGRDRQVDRQSQGNGMPAVNDTGRDRQVDRQSQGNTAKNAGSVSTDSESTTDTFKKMREKTQKLQQRFTELEKKLNKIKNNDDPSPKKIHDQIQAYTDYYYTDFVDISNDSDLI